MRQAACPLVLDALTSNPAWWSKTALFLMYDENDGWFDHVPPPTVPAGTPGEYLAAAPPKLGGHIASEVFDHTSQLQLVSKRFGVEVPNVSAWRRETVGDLTSTMFQSPANANMPKLPASSVLMPVSGPCAAPSQDTESGGAQPSVPTKQTMPTQGGGSQPASKHFPTTESQEAVADDDPPCSRPTARVR